MIIRDNIHIGQNIDIFYVKSDNNRKIRKAGTNEEPVDEAIYPVGSSENGEQEEIPELEQPDSTNTYGYGVKVRYNGQIWESTHDHNSWPPGTPGVWVLVEE